MNISALIKLSHRHPTGAVSRATFEYLSSMAKEEGLFSKRKASKAPSDYWRKALATYSVAVSGTNPAPYLALLEKKASHAPRFKGEAGSLMRLALQSHPLRVILAEDPLEELQELQESTPEPKEEEKEETPSKKEEKETSPKKEQKKEKEPQSAEYEQKRDNALSLLSRYKKQLMESGGGEKKNAEKRKTWSALRSTIESVPEIEKERKQVSEDWNKALSKEEKVKYEDLNGEKKEAELKLLSMRDWSKIQNEERREKYKERWEEAYGGYVDKILDLTLRAILWEGAEEEDDDVAPAEEAKSEPEPEEDDSDWDFEGYIPPEEKPKKKKKKDKGKKDDEMDIENAKEIILKAGGDPSGMTDDEMRAAALSILKGGRGRGGKKTTDELDGEVDPQESAEGLGLSDYDGGNLFKLEEGYDDGDFGQFSVFDGDFGGNPYKYASAYKKMKKAMVLNHMRIKRASTQLRKIRGMKRW